MCVSGRVCVSVAVSNNVSMVYTCAVDVKQHAVQRVHHAGVSVECIYLMAAGMLLKDLI